MIRLLRGAERFVSDDNGIRSLHWYSSGAHYDPQRMGFASLVGYDEHIVAPGRGFEAHPHRGVDIYTWVLEGTLEHCDDAGNVHEVHPGMLQIQRTGTGVEHSETNPSATEDLRFLQILLLPSDNLAAPQYILGTYHEIADAGLAPIEHIQLRPDVSYELADAVAHVQVLSGSVVLQPLSGEEFLGQGEKLAAEDCLEVKEQSVALVAREATELLITTVR